MGRYYKNELHGPIQDYAYELPFNELFTMQKYKRAEDDKAKTALQAGYDALYKINYKPGDEAKVAQLRNNFSNLTDNIYKKYGNNLANATGSIQQGINAVLDSGLLSDINANYKTWIANETTKAALYKSGQFQPMPEVAAQAYRPTEDAQGRRRDYEQYLASVDVRPEQEAIYNNIPKDERTYSRLDESAIASALQYARSNPQHIIQRYGQEGQTALNLAAQGDVSALETLSYTMLKETLPEYVTAGTTTTGDTTGDGGEDIAPTVDFSRDAITSIMNGEPVNITNTEVAQWAGLDETEKGRINPFGVRFRAGDESIIIDPATFTTSTSGFIYDPDIDNYRYVESGLNQQESAEQAAELQALDNYYNTYEAQYNELGIGISKETIVEEVPAGGKAPGITRTVEKPANVDAEGNAIEFDPERVYESGVFAKIKDNPNLQKGNLRQLEGLGIDPDDPETVKRYKAYKKHKEEVGQDAEMEKYTKQLITAINASGMEYDFDSQQGDNTFIALDENGNLALYVRGFGSVSTEDIDNLLDPDTGFFDWATGPQKSTEKKPFFDNPWNQPGGLFGSSFSLVGKGNLLQDKGPVKAVDVDGSTTATTRYDFPMVQKIPLTYESYQNHNLSKFIGTGSEEQPTEREQNKNYTGIGKELGVRSLNKRVVSEINRDLKPYFKSDGNLGKSFESEDASNQNVQVLTPEAKKEIEDVYNTDSRILDNAIAKGRTELSIHKDMYTALKDYLTDTSVDINNPEQVKKYEESLEKFYAINEYMSEALKRNAPAYITKAATNAALSTILNSSEEIYTTGIVDNKIVNEDALKRYTTLQAKAHNLTQINTDNFSSIELSDDISGPYTSVSGINTLNLFNNALSMSNKGSAVVTSSFRTPAYNNTLKESANKSLHIQGKAFDLRDNDAARYLYTEFQKGNFRNYVADFHPHTVNGVRHYHIELK